MSEQTAEERAAEGVNALLIKVERLETEVASVRLAGVVCLERAEAQLEKAVELLQLAKCIGQNPDSNADYYCWMHGGPKEEYCPRCTFLASTVTPPCVRVSVRPHTPGDETDHICAYHGCPWPDGGECRAKEKV